MFIYTYTIFKSNHNRIIFDKIFNDNIYRIIIINYSIVDEFSLILYHVNFKISFTHFTYFMHSNSAWCERNYTIREKVTIFGRSGWKIVEHVGAVVVGFVKSMDYPWPGGDNSPTVHSRLFLLLSQRYKLVSP